MRSMLTKALCVLAVASRSSALLCGRAGSAGSVRAVGAAQLGATHRIDAMEVEGSLEPLSNYLYVEVDKTSETSAGGVMISAKAQEPPKVGTVRARGPGREHPESGAAMPVEAEIGERVMWGRYAGATVKYDGKEHTLLKDRDVIMAWTGDLTAETARPIGGNVLLKVSGSRGQTEAGLFLGLAAVDQVLLEGEIVRVGPGAALRDGSRLAQPVEVGDMVRFRDYDVAEVDIDGEEYVLFQSECVSMKWKAA